MIEVEIKLPITKPAKIQQDLENLEFIREKEMKETDLYFNSAWHDLKQRDEALRIRTCENLLTGQSHTVITYKGPKLDKVSMTRKELETEVAEAAVCDGIFTALGFTERYPVIKQRRYFTKKADQKSPWEVTACVDCVEGLGDFLELEVLIPDEERRKAALSLLEEILQKLGYTMAETTRTSYLSMLQQQKP